MLNHNRGLWGYTGRAADGELLSVQSTGMGGPSAAIVLEELADLGVTTAVRVGTCGALDGGLAHGDLLVVREAIADDGTSRALGAGERVCADSTLTTALEASTGRSAALVASTDVFYERRPERSRRWALDGAVAVEMESATLFRVGELRGVAVGCVLAVTDVRTAGDDERLRIDDDAYGDLAAALADAAAAALGIDVAA